MQKISDYELMRRVVNENDEWAKIHLWHRYQPVVHKRASYMMTIVGSRWEKDDLIQEFFLSFLKAIDYIDLSKIPDESFHFGTIYFFFLRKTENKIKKIHFRLNGIEEDSYEKLFHPELENTKDHNDIFVDPRAKETVSHSVHFDFDESSVLFNSVELPAFRSKLSSDQNSVLDDLLERKKIADISRTRKQKYMHVYKIVIDIRKKAKHHFVGVN